MTLRTLIYITVAVLAIVFLFKHRFFIFNLPSLIFWKVKDNKSKDNTFFPYYGVTYYAGPQGSGKTMSLVHALEEYRKQYPLVKIYTNFGYKYETAALNDIYDLINPDLYNDEQGTIFVLDEIQNEFAASTSANFPPNILQTITQLRKQNILVLCTTQVFTRVSKPLREQAKYVVECETFFGRLTETRKYDGNEYADGFDKSEKYKKEHLVCIEHKAFVQTDELRDCYDSYQLINRLSRVGFRKSVED